MSKRLSEETKGRILDAIDSNIRIAISSYVIYWTGYKTETRLLRENDNLRITRENHDIIVKIQNTCLRDAFLSVARIFDEDSRTAKYSILSKGLGKEWLDDLNAELEPIKDLRNSLLNDRNNYFAHSTAKFESGSTSLPEQRITIRSLRKLILYSILIAQRCREPFERPADYEIVIRTEHAKAQKFWLGLYSSK